MKAERESTYTLVLNDYEFHILYNGLHDYIISCGLFNPLPKNTKSEEHDTAIAMMKKLKEVDQTTADITAPVKG